MPKSDIQRAFGTIRNPELALSGRRDGSHHVLIRDVDQTR